MSNQSTIDYLCSECNQIFSFQREIAPGNNLADVTCSHCGEQWHISFQVLSLEPLLIGDWGTYRQIGVLRGNTFYAKEQLQ
jgi:DNA-directed RNA polymerase subunit RPC12/RpoP